MVIFKYEMKNHFKYILSWSVALAVFIFVMIPVYYSLLGGAESNNNSLYDTLGSTDFFQSIGFSLDYLTTPLGVYSFLTSFFMIAAGIFGMHFGISIHTKEFSGKTSEYLFTKPHTRKDIFLSKAYAVFCGTLIVGIFFMSASFLALLLFHPGFSVWDFFLISKSLFLVTLFLAAFGLLIGIAFSANRSPLLTAGLIVFVEYCITSSSRIVGNRMLSFLSPYSFFSAAEISRIGFYELDYLTWYLVLLVIFLLTAYSIFMKKDVQFRS